MNFIEFQKNLLPYPVFSLLDARKAVADFSYRQLDRWTKKGYLRKVRRGYYALADREIEQDILFYTASKIYYPSYISLETALKFYGFIPEEIFQVTSVSTRKTARFNTSIGNFSYRHVKPGLFFGYRLLEFVTQKILMAEPEKAVLDYLYLNPRLKTRDDFLEMRINGDEFLEKIDFVIILKYLRAYDNKSLARRAETFLSIFS
jgi:predicted transcriptional regulator of viral defense system